MGLPRCQQRALDGIDATLRSRDPRLASMFSIFTRLAGQDPLPGLEQVVPRGRAAAARAGRGLRRVCSPHVRLGAVMIAPLALVVIICFAVLGPLAGSPGCRTAPQARTSAALAGRWPAACDGSPATNTTVFQH
jgi:hypothetical protein